MYQFRVLLAFLISSYPSPTSITIIIYYYNPHTTASAIVTKYTPLWTRDGTTLEEDEMS